MFMVSILICRPILLKDLVIKSTLNGTQGKEKNGIPLRHAAPLFGSTHLVFETSKLTADLYSSITGQETFENMPPSEIEKPYMYAKDKNGNPWSPGWSTLKFQDII